MHQNQPNKFYINHLKMLTLIKKNKANRLFIRSRDPKSQISNKHKMGEIARENRPTSYNEKWLERRKEIALGKRAEIKSI